MVKPFAVAVVVADIPFATVAAPEPAPRATTIQLYPVGIPSAGTDQFKTALVVVIVPVFNAVGLPHDGISPIENLSKYTYASPLP